MGNFCKSERSAVISDQFNSFEELNEHLKSRGLESCQTLVAIDFTSSNNQHKSNDGLSLHHIDYKSEQPPGYDEDPETMKVRRQVTQTFTFTTAIELKEAQKAMRALNPYQYVMAVAGNEIEKFDSDRMIPTAIFGHNKKDKDPYVQEINETPEGNYTINGVIRAYENALRTYQLAGPTLFVPILEWAEQKVIQSGYKYHILIIIGDGIILDMQTTKMKLKELNTIPLSIIFVGVGDGSDPKEHDKWRSMKELDNCPLGAIDTWQSVYLANLKSQLEASSHPDVELALHMYMEIPDQYNAFKQRELIRS